MKIYRDIDITEFEAWSGGLNCFKALSRLGKLEAFGDWVDELCDEGVFPEGLSETALNDILWFEDEEYCEVLGISEEAWNEVCGSL